jgi:hypothetical protein
MWHLFICSDHQWVSSCHCFPLPSSFNPCTRTHIKNITHYIPHSNSIIQPTPWLLSICCHRKATRSISDRCMVHGHGKTWALTLTAFGPSQPSRCPTGALMRVRDVDATSTTSGSRATDVTPSWITQSSAGPPPGYLISKMMVLLIRLCRWDCVTMPIEINMVLWVMLIIGGQGYIGENSQKLGTAESDRQYWIERTRLLEWY